MVFYPLHSRRAKILTVIRRRPPPIDFYRRHCQALNRSGWVNGWWFMVFGVEFQGLWFIGNRSRDLVIGVAFQGVWYLGWNSRVYGLLVKVYGVWYLGWLSGMFSPGVILF